MDLITSIFNVVHHVALEAVFDAARATEEVSLCLILFDEHVVTAVGRAFPHVLVRVPDLFPLKLLAPLHLFCRQELFQVRERDRLFAARLRAHDRKLTIFNARFEPWVDTFLVINV